MLGGHLDSWHSATGATDNAIGCAIMMEAARILKVIGVQPRRTIRVALWSGEEEGLLGSLAYVKQHFGSAENPKPEFAKFAGYLNIDSGTGRPRGASVFGPPEAAAILREILAPFKDLQVGGRHRRRRAAPPAAPTARRSTTPACPASASARIRSSTAATRITRTSIPTSASSKRTCATPRSSIAAHAVPARDARRDAAPLRGGRHAACAAAASGWALTSTRG